MKTLVTTLCIIVIFFGKLYSQGGNHHIDREEIKKRKYAFIQKELQLTDKEIKEFMPLYKEFDDKREALHDQRRKMMHNFKQNSLNITDADLNELIDKFVEMEIQQAELGKQYTEKFKTVLPPMKIILLQYTENEFKRMLLKHFHDDKPRGRP